MCNKKMRRNAKRTSNNVVLKMGKKDYFQITMPLTGIMKILELEKREVTIF